MKYKTFKDLGIGDCLYVCNKRINKIYRLQVTDIIKDEILARFYFSELPWDYISVPLEDFERSKADTDVFADINLLFNYINENV